MPAVAVPLLVVNRTAAAQSELRIGHLSARRNTPDYPALLVMNAILGGQFVSRINMNLREDKGYTYGPHSRIDHNVLGSSLMFDVEVATEVTAAALLETLYELGRIASLPVTEAEVESVRRCAARS